MLNRIVMQRYVFLYTRAGRSSLTKTINVLISYITPHIQSKDIGNIIFDHESTGTLVIYVMLGPSQQSKTNYSRETATGGST